MKHRLPDEIRLLADKTALQLTYHGIHKVLPAEFLRVYSPSAEVRGHGVGNAILQTGKCGITIKHIEPAGQYALKIVFSDGHNSGLYDWDYLYQLAHEYATMWADYERRLAEAGASRLPDPSVNQHSTTACSRGGCGKH